ncbi:MAG: hypothetical protein J0J01_24550 [Reyranella sp.]|uniref:hypothetical protein n=1 Tax=Reyranella sp. TaxID=1929291 RepID=UPI001ACEA179|nr:hypothetical protein [Reyranella sp.]MBN9090093.1 hypothetical protein [Reyranella sp.]
MIKRVAAIVAAFLIPTASIAQTCGSGLPYNLTNGTNADATQVMANFNYIVTCFATLGANTFTGAQTLPGNPTSALQAATKQYVDAGGGASGGGDRRQTVAAGPVTTAGLPNFLPSTSASLSLTSANVSSTAPFAATAANNVASGTGASQDTTGVSTSNLTWSSLTASAANYLYVTISSGALAAGSTTLAPIYQMGGTPATTSGQFTFNIGEMRGYLGNGTSAPQASLVFVGEAVTNASTVTSTVAYAYNGLYESAFTATLPAANTAASAYHNIGVTPRVIDWIIENTTTELNYAVGDQIHAYSLMSNPSTILGTVSLSASRLTMSAITTQSNSSPWIMLNKTSGAQSGLTAGNWKYKFYANRGW